MAALRPTWAQVRIAPLNAGKRRQMKNTLDSIKRLMHYVAHKKGLKRQKNIGVRYKNLMRTQLRLMKSGSEELHNVYKRELGEYQMAFLDYVKPFVMSSLRAEISTEDGDLLEDTYQDFIAEILPHIVHCDPSRCSLYAFSLPYIEKAEKKHLLTHARFR
jgi:hypothetical protein